MDSQRKREPCGYTAGSVHPIAERPMMLEGDYRLEGLMNEVEYEVVVAALDAAGNRSEQPIEHGQTC